MSAAGLPVAEGLAVIAGNVPLGSGLSSSAALEAALCLALGNGRASPEAALLCQRAENRWAGVPCGIMDQFTSFMAEEGRALFLDCRDLSWRNIELPAGTAMTVVDSGVRRELAASEYAKRRQEIETALVILRKVAGPLPALRDLTPEAFAEAEDLLPEPLRSRVEHVVGAIARVREGVTCLALADSAGFGALMVECHRSLAHLYEVSIPELDRIVELALAVEGVFGARLTGAGFGGCVIVFHGEGCSEALRREVTEGFEKRFGRQPAVHLLRAAGGARVGPIE
jgi:galactokinase